MCEENDCKCHSEGKHHGRHHRYHNRHHMGYNSIVKRVEKDVLVPEVLLEVAEVNEGDFFEISVRKIRKHQHHHEE
jgi:hypothetical protein